MKSHIYTENLDETFGVTRECEGDADTIHLAVHEHDWVTPTLAVGCGVWNEDDVRAIVADGITHVIDCRETASTEILYARVGIAYLHCPLPDDGSLRGERWFLSGIDFVADAPKILVHCNMGLNRGPSMAYAILRERHGAEEAENLIRTARLVGPRFAVYIAEWDAFLNNAR